MIRPTDELALENSEKYCVFKSAGDWFGVPALAIRNIAPARTVTPVPYSDPTLKGICHIQNEFIPVVSFVSLTQIQYETTPGAEQQLLILNGPLGSWGLLIDQAIALAAIEISFSTVSQSSDNWSKVTLGSASFRNQVIQVLDPQAMQHYAAKLLNMYWQSSALPAC